MERFMHKYKTPLSVVFIWHPGDTETVKQITDYCSCKLKKDTDKPFSRAINIPIFYRTTLKKEIPSNIQYNSRKVIVFPFIGTNIVADNDWIEYLKNLTPSDNFHIVPIALDTNAYNLNDIFENINFIRLIDLDVNNINILSFIAIAHEIYRFTLNNKFSDFTSGNSNALKLFLSHSKQDGWAVELASALKNIIDNSTMQNFFDTTDIAPGYKFDSEISGYINDSTVIAIHSDSYSSRYWCQREIICAKENKRPLLAVNCLNDFEDRRFTYSSNIPVINIANIDYSNNTAHLRILAFALLETIRNLYNDLLLKEYKDSNWFKSDTLLLTRPPEASDILNLLVEDDKNFRATCTDIIYPEPNVYDEEHLLLNKFKINIFTPLTIDTNIFKDYSIGISISDLSTEELVLIGQDEYHLKGLSQDIARHLLSRGTILIYGGDLRPNGFTEYIFEEALILQNRLQSTQIQLVNYIAWPIFKNNSKETKLWKAKYRKNVTMSEILPPDDVNDLIPSIDTYLPPSNSQNSFVWSRCLTKMREEMITNCNVRIAAGGKHIGYKGKMPGVLEEILISISLKKPLYLLGGFGGVTSTVCKCLENNSIDFKLTEDWQIQNNSGYKKLLDFATSRGSNYGTDYNEIKKIFSEYKIDELSQINGLSSDDNIRLFNTPFVDEALHLILKGLQSIYEATS